MDRYDDRNEAVLRVTLTALDDSVDAETLPYEDVLRSLQVLLIERLQGQGARKPEDPEAGTQDGQAVREAVGRLDPHPEDQYLDYPSLLYRLQGTIDRELFRWTSNMVQPPGPSGEIQTPPAPPVEETPVGAARHD